METWYVLESGDVAHPRDVRPDRDGKLRHKDGRAVAYAPHGPRSRSVDPDAERAKAVPAGKRSTNEARAVSDLDELRAASALPPVSGGHQVVHQSEVTLKAKARDLTADDDKPATADREMKPAPTSGKGYRTRGTKAE